MYTSGTDGEPRKAAASLHEASQRPAPCCISHPNGILLLLLFFFFFFVAYGSCSVPLCLHTCRLACSRPFVRQLLLQQLSFSEIPGLHTCPRFVSLSLSLPRCCCSGDWRARESWVTRARRVYMHRSRAFFPQSRLVAAREKSSLHSCAPMRVRVVLFCACYIYYIYRSWWFFGAKKRRCAGPPLGRRWVNVVKSGESWYARYKRVWSFWRFFRLCAVRDGC